LWLYYFVFGLISEIYKVVSGDEEGILG
jgi:hypothetical protein